MKELPFPLTVSTENASLVEKKKEEKNTHSCAEAAIRLLRENLNGDSSCLCSASTEMTDAASVGLLGSRQGGFSCR